MRKAQAGFQGPPHIALPIAIVADDLTGCCDAAAPFAGRATTVNVVCSPAPAFCSDADVVACCTASRGDRPVEAALKVEALCRSLAATASWRLFKKIDSTLKGNIGAEVESMLGHSPAVIAVICPAFPAQGRTLERGYLRVAGKAASEDHLPSILSDQSKLPLRHFTTDAASQLLAAPSLERSTLQPALWVVDAANSHELSNVGKIIDRLGSAALAVGSSGLARVLAQQWLPPSHRVIRRDTMMVPTDFFAVIGTQNNVTAQQLEHLRKWHGGFLADGEIAGEVARCDSGRPTVFRYVWSTASDRSLATFLDRLGDRLPGTLLLSGGDTAQRCCQMTNTQKIEIYGEFEAGVPCGRTLDGTLRGWQMVTKAGGFGSPDTLSRLSARLQPSSSAGHLPFA